MKKLCEMAEYFTAPLIITLLTRNTIINNTNDEKKNELVRSTTQRTTEFMAFANTLA